MHLSFDLTKGYFQYQRTDHDAECYRSVWRQTSIYANMDMMWTNKTVISHEGKKKALPIGTTTWENNIEDRVENRFPRNGPVPTTPVSPRDIFSINGLTMMLNAIGQCDVKHIIWDYR
jgi:hypothetical protein